MFLWLEIYLKIVDIDLLTTSILIIVCFSTISITADTVWNSLKYMVGLFSNGGLFSLFVKKLVA